jgi:hypothetical protein
MTQISITAIKSVEEKGKTSMVQQWGQLCARGEIWMDCLSGSTFGMIRLAKLTKLLLSTLNHTKVSQSEVLRGRLCRPRPRFYVS